MNSNVIEIYKSVLTGDLKKFPYGFWQKVDGRCDNSIICCKYLFEEILKWDLLDIKNNLTTKVIRQYKLAGMLEVYNNSIYLLLNDIYPNQIHPWELKCTPMSYWADRQNRINALKWLFDKLKIDDKNVKSKFNVNNFKKYGLGALLESKYNNSPYLALNELYPDKYHVWEVSRVPKKYWDDENNCKRATMWLIEKVGLSYDELSQTLTRSIFEESGLGAMLKIKYKGSPYLAIYDISHYNLYKLQS